MEIAGFARVGGDSGQERQMARRYIVKPQPSLGSRFVQHDTPFQRGRLDLCQFLGIIDVLEPLDADQRAGLRERQHMREFRSEEHTSELQSLMRISYAVFCLKKKKQYSYPSNNLEQYIKKTAHLNIR